VKWDGMHQEWELRNSHKTLVGKPEGKRQQVKRLKRERIILKWMLRK
jgi:hypothetical protein